jgi:hypothetical protein
MLQVASTECRVAIVAPDGTKFGFIAEAEAQIPDADPLSRSLLAVDTQKDLSQACGSFTLRLDARPHQDGRRWAERIPMRSLVFIALLRSGVTPSASSTVMIGLTDTHAVQEQYSEAHPRRGITITGREIAAVMLDATLVYHPGLSANVQAGTLTVENGTLGALQTALSANPLLVSRGDPRTVLQVLLDTYLFRGGTSSSTTPTEPGSATPVVQHPLIHLDLPNYGLEQLLVPQYAIWRTFDDVSVDIGQFPAMLGSLWTYLHLYIDRNFQEFFTRMEGGQCQIHFRGKPFRHKLITTGTRFKAQGTGPEEEPTLATLTLDPADIVSHVRERDASHIYNYFTVMPRGIWDEAELFQYGVLPEVISDPSHPSFVGRYGIRPLRAQSQYLSQLAPLSAALASADRAALPLTPQPAASSVWADKANHYATEVGVSAAHRPWFVALIHQESYFNPNAVWKSKDGSRDEGIAQFNNVHGPNPASVGLTNPFDPDNALPAAARYWQQLRAQVGDDPRLIAAAYNAGAGAVLAAKGVPPQAARHTASVESFVPRYQGYAGTTTGPTASTAAAGVAASTGDARDILATSQRWSAILRAWYDAGGELWNGQLVVRGSPEWNIGHRLLTWDERGEWEAYIEGVHHAYEYRTGQYLTTIRYTRGWYLEAAIAQQIWEEGRTTVTRASGGPPSHDPQTGLPLIPDDRFANTPLLGIRPQPGPVPEGETP